MRGIALISAASVWQKAWPIIIAILFFGLLVFFHELGHFTFAKLFKVKVNEFSMGMGPALFKRKKGETLYALRLFPIGGYVSMEGEDEDSECENAFNKKLAWQRFIIVAAGGVINLIMGLVIVIIMLSNSQYVGTPTVNYFYENSVSSQYGLQAKDTIVEIDGKRVYSNLDISFLMSRSDDGIYDFVVKRDGEKVELRDVKFASERLEVNGKETLSITYDFTLVGKEPNVINVLTTSVRETMSLSRMVWLSLLDLATGRYGLSDLSGPIGTVSVIAEVVEDGRETMDFSTAFFFMALIAVNIGLFNLLPLPALDGGRLLFLFIEMIFRKPVPQKYEGWVHTIGFALLMLLMVVICFSDIMKLIKG